MVALWNLFYFIIALGILVTIHEFGHFWVARKLGVKVLTFSVGFGKPLWQHQAKDGVNYVIAAIPLGGYVKMLDEREGEVALEDLSFAFNRKSVWARMAIVLAGPVANFILAIALYWWMFLLGINGLSTEMGIIDESSIAGKAGLSLGDKIIQIDGEDVYLLQDVVKSVARRLGETTEINVAVEKNSQKRDYQLDLSDWQVDSSKPEIIESLGIRHKLYDLVVLPVIADVEQDSPADKANLKIGDRIVKYNDVSIESWQQLVKLTQLSKNQTVELLIERNGELSKISVVIGSHDVAGKLLGFMGILPVRPDRSDYFVTREAGVVESFFLSLQETGKMISLSSRLFVKLLTGDISTKSLSGPLSIAEGAGNSAKAGLVYFISFIAMISVNLGFINLLPVPLLDGGHLLYYVIEVIKGKPLSDRVQEVGLQVGMLMVFALMATAIFNDLSRL